MTYYSLLYSANATVKPDCVKGWVIRSLELSSHTNRPLIYNTLKGTPVSTTHHPAFTR